MTIRRFFSFRPFIDVLFCCLLMLVAILFLLKTEEEKTKMRPPNVLYEVILTWDGNSEDDLDIYVQSSSSEGSPLTIKEAMAASLPIISTKVGGVPEMIIDGETGILVPHDDQEKFVYALIELINMDVENREKMGKKAYSYAMKNYSMESLAKKNAAIYENQCRKSKKHY